MKHAALVPLWSLSACAASTQPRTAPPCGSLAPPPVTTTKSSTLVGSEALLAEIRVVRTWQEEFVDYLSDAVEIVIIEPETHAGRRVVLLDCPLTRTSPWLVVGATYRAKISSSDAFAHPQHDGSFRAPFRSVRLVDGVYPEGKCDPTKLRAPPRAG